MKVGRCLLVVLGLVGASSSVFGGPIVVFNNFGAGNTYDSGGWAIGGSNLTAVADPFMPSLNTNLSSILIALGGNASTAGNVVVSVRTGSTIAPDLTPSSTILESWTLNSASLPAFGTSSGATESLSSVLNPLLTAGQWYWIEVAPQSSTVSIAWNQNSIGNSGNLWSNFGGGVQFLGALEVTGHATPEPSSIALVGAGVLVGLIRLRKRSC
jgi:hypothetical protein